MILYQGPSRIDGSPIVAIATIDSANPKTADMVQVWIIRSDMHPSEAIKLGKDNAICGECPQRWNKGGGCYVIVANGPAAVYRRFATGDGYQDENHIRRVTKALVRQPIRLGAYGDPTAVPFEVWEELIAQGCHLWTGYTHSWHLAENQEYRQLLMASCDSQAEARKAKAMGWRFFLVQKDIKGLQADPLLGSVVECLNTSKRRLTCDECGACDGTRADSRSINATSIVVEVHGFKRNKFALPVLN
jgi:hypothetical protein